MFITLTINTKYNNRKIVRLGNKRQNPARGWKRSLIIKKQTTTNKLMQWVKSFKQKAYLMDGQVAMY